MLVFAHPWLLLLLPLPWLIRALVPPRRERLLAVRVPFGQRLERSISNAGSITKSVEPAWKRVIRIAVWLLVLLALARPQWIEPAVSRNLPTRDLLLLVDLSGSMRQEDFVNSTGEKVDRLTAVKEVLGEFLVRREGDRVGLVVFGDAPYLQSPFSTDLDLSRQLLDECAIGMAGPRTALGDGIGLGVHLFEQSNMPAKTIIALTDGNDTKSQVPPVEAARVAAERGIRIHTVAIGDPTTVGEEKLDEETLREVAEEADGSYFFANDREELNKIYEELDRIETREVKTVSHRPRRDLFYWLIGAALLISLSEKAILAWLSQREEQSRAQSRKVHVDPMSGKLEVVE